MPKWALTSLYAAAMSAASNDHFVAINDLVPAGAAAPKDGRCTWTRLTHGRNWKGGGGEFTYGPNKLLDTSGRKIDATLELVEKTSHETWTINNAKDKVKVKKGTPAWEEYGWCLCNEENDCDAETGECSCEAFDGNLSYNDAPGWELRYIFSGLNPQCEAEVSFFVDRGPGNHGNLPQNDYTQRYSLFTLKKTKSSAAQGALALASLKHGATLALRSGENSQGRIAKWTHIKHDGTFEVVATHGSQSLAKLLVDAGDDAGVSPAVHDFKGYAGGVLKLRQICPEEPIVLACPKADEGTDHTPLIVGAAAAAAAAALAVGAVVMYRWRTKAAQKTAQQVQQENPNEILETLGVSVGKADIGDIDKNSDASTKATSDNHSDTPSGENPQQLNNEAV